MHDKKIKEVLIESLEREQELYDFCIDCLKRIYPDQWEQAILKFDEGLNFHFYNGCIQSLHCIDLNLKRDKEEEEELGL